MPSSLKNQFWQIHLPDVYTFRKQFVLASRDLLHNEVLKKGYNAKFSTINQLYETAHMIKEASHYNHGMQCAENAHTAVSNTKPTTYKTQLLKGQSRTIIGRENVMHCTQTTHAYNAPKPEQKTVQVKDSSTKQAIDRNLCCDCLRGKVIAWM